MSTGGSTFPDIDDPATAPFWAATARGEIAMQSCGDCGYVRWPPSPICPECLSARGKWTAIASTGTVWSHATYHRAMSPATAKDVPYTVVLVELDDGPHIYGRLISGDPPIDAPIEPGTRVRAVFYEIEPGVSFIGWRVDR